MPGISLVWYLSMLVWRSSAHQPDCFAFYYTITLPTNSSGVRRVLKDMLLCEVDVDGRYFYDNTKNLGTGLMVAAQRGFTDIVSELAKKTNDIDKEGFLGYTALELAAQNGHHQAVSILLKHGADELNKKPDYTPLMMAAKTGNNQACLNLLENGADVNVVTNDDMTALKLAAKYNQFEVVKTLLAHGADIDYSPERQNALILAGKNGHLDIFAFLLDNGADMSSLNNDGYTPLIFAIKSYFKDNMTAINMIQILLDHGADINLRDGKYGNTALMSIAARYEGKENILAALLDKGADVNVRKTPPRFFVVEIIAQKDAFLRPFSPFLM